MGTDTKKTVDCPFCWRKKWLMMENCCAKSIFNGNVFVMDCTLSQYHMYRRKGQKIGNNAFKARDHAQIMKSLLVIKRPAPPFLSVVTFWTTTPPHICDTMIFWWLCILNLFFKTNYLPWGGGLGGSVKVQTFTTTKH